jgi:hypothetical protein
MKKKIFVTILIIGVMYCLFLKLYHSIQNHVWDCNKIRNDISELTGISDKKLIRVCFYHQSNWLEIYFDDIGSIDKVYQVYQYMEEKMDEKNFWLSQLQSNYIIRRGGGPKGMYDYIEISIENFQTETGNEKQVSMEIRTGGDTNDRIKKYVFDEVDSLNIRGYYDADRMLEDLTVLEHFPNLSYLNLYHKSLTQEEYEYIRSVLPQDCEIEGYEIKYE